MIQPDRTPSIYGPIQSKIAKVAEASPFTASSFIGEDRAAYDVSFQMELHLGTTNILDPRLLKAFGAIRDVTSKHPVIERVPLDEINQALEIGHHFRYGYHGSKVGISITAQRDALLEAYIIDQKAIDRALDFEAAKQQEQI